MLNCLRIRNFAIIDHLEVDFGPALNVLTGETGAGKSIIVDALELVLGERARPQMVRTGADQAEIEALFDIAGDPIMRDRLTDADLADEDALLVRRVVQREGRSRAYVNGRLVTTGQLARLTSGLADICSQHEHHALVDSASHLRFLDSFAELNEPRALMAEAYGALQEADRALRDLRARLDGRALREDILRFQVKEIDELDPQPVDENELPRERERLRHAESLHEVAAEGEALLYARDDAVCARLSGLADRLTEAAQRDGDLAEAATMVDSARAQLEEAARDLGNYARRVESDPARLQEVEERLHRVERLTRKYGGGIGELLVQRERLRTELEEIGHEDECIAMLDVERKEALERAGHLALQLSTERQRAAQALGRAISHELATLGMGDAQVEVEVAPLEGRGDEFDLDGRRLSPLGFDRVTFLIAPNRGEHARPLRDIASGGELSRSMLAIRRVLSGLGQGGFHVFDEVDAGVGGAVAEAIGLKLREVSRRRQVLCITHLPQIAVFADSHLLVHKDVEDGRTKSDIRALTGSRRRDEVARMLGGRRITEQTRATAEELIRQAHEG